MTNKYRHETRRDEEMMKALSIAAMLCIMLLAPTFVVSIANAQTRIDALTLLSGEANPSSAVIDAANGYAYFGTGTNPGRVVKVRLSDFIRVDALTLDPGELDLHSAVIDTVNGYAYFATSTRPAKVIKIQLSDFTRVATLTLNTDESYPCGSAVIDTVHGYAYFGTCTSPYKVVKIRLSDFTRVSAMGFGPEEHDPYSAVIDVASGYAYFGMCTYPGMGPPGAIAKVALGSGDAAPTEVGVLALDPGEDEPLSAVIDTANGYAYFGAIRVPPAGPAKVVKIRLSDFSRVAAVALGSGENDLRSAVIDAAGSYAYFGTNGVNPGRVVKIRLLDMTRVSATDLNPGEYNLASAVLDTVNGYAYFGTSTSPGKVVRVGIWNVALSPTIGGAGTVVSVSGSGYAGTTCTLSATPSGLFSSSTCSISAGTLTGSFTVASGAPGGTYAVTVQTNVPAQSATAEFISGSSSVSVQCLTQPPTTPIAFDAASGASSGSTSTLTWSHTVGSGATQPDGSGANRILLVGVSDNGFIVNGVSYGGLPLTQAGPPSSITARAEMWFLIDPPSGTASIVVSMGNVASVVGGAVSYFNVDQTTPISSYNRAVGVGGAFDRNPSVSIVNECGHVLVDTVAIASVGNPTPASGQTQRWNLVNGIVGAGSDRESLGEKMSWISGGGYWSQFAVSLNPSMPCSGGETVTFTTNAGAFQSVMALPVSSVSQAPPAGLEFPFGLFFPTITTSLTVGQTVTVTIVLPSALPPGDFSYWKYHDGSWQQMPSDRAILDSTRTVITLFLTDGASPDDADGSANGVIVDPGGAAITSPHPTPTSTPVGGIITPTNKLETLAPYLALAGLITVVSTVIVARRRRG